MNSLANGGMTRLRVTGYGAAGEIRMPNHEGNQKHETRIGAATRSYSWLFVAIQG